MSAEMAIKPGLIDLRHLLRERTSIAHQSLDDRFSQLNLQTEAGYGLFLKSHHMALGHCYRAVEKQCTAFELFPPNPIGLLRDDIKALGLTTPKVWEPAKKLEGQWLGTAYVLAGARLGARVLLKRVQKATPSMPANATSFLESQQDPMPWRLVVAALQTKQMTAFEAEPILLAAKSTFEVFEQALGDLL